MVILRAHLKNGTGAPIFLEPSPRPYHVLAYRKDAAGNVSSMSSWEYSVNTEAAVTHQSFSVESPVSGDFINPQFLYINRTGDDRIFYTLDGGNPLGPEGREYTEGILIKERGSIHLQVASRSSSGIESSIQSVRYTVSGGRDIPAVVASGVFDGHLSFSLTGESLRYTFDERMPVISDLDSDAQVTLYPVQGGIIFYSLRCRLLEQEKLSAGQYRYFYAIDARNPAEPLIAVEGSAPYSRSPELTITASDYAQVRYTLDGTEPDLNSKLYEKPFSPEIRSGTGVLSVKAAAYSKNGRRSDTAVRLIPYDFEKPAVPEVTAIPSDHNIEFELNLPEDTAAVYEIAFLPAFPSEPGILSPEWQGEALQVPWGMSCDGKIRFASKDRAGNISTWVETSFFLDRTPPSEPSISFVDNNAVIEGEGRIYYSLSSRDDAKSSDSGFAEYTLPISVSPRDGLLSSYRVSAYSEDEAGNRSAIVQQDIFLDERLPVVPLIRGIEDRRVYNVSTVKPSYTIQDHDFEIRYTLGMNEQIPEDPTVDSPLLNTCIIETPEGEEVYYHLKLLPVFPVRGRIGKVVSYRFSVDRKLPDLPEIIGLPGAGVSKGRVELSLGGIGEDETVYYRLGRKNHNSEETFDSAADPVIEGEVYTAPLIFEPSAGEDVEYSLSIAVTDKAGNRNALEEPLLFRIDRNPPALPFIDGVPVSGVSSNPLRIEIVTPDEVSAEYRLISERELSSNALVPFKQYTGPVSIEGNEKVSTVYQFEYRSKDAAGNFSAETGITTITLDRRTIPQPDAPVVTYAESDGRALLSWPWNSGGELFFRLGSRGDFVQYVTPVSVTLHDQGESLIQYYLEQKSGIRSAMHSMDIRSTAAISAGHLFKGIQNGQTYGGEVSLSPAENSSGSVVRYEAGYNGNNPELKRLSPLFNNKLIFNVPFGTEKVFNLIFGLFTDRNSSVPAKTESLTFTIDRSPPVPPVLTEVINTDVESRFKLIELDSRGELVKYTLREKGVLSGPFSYEGVLSLDTRGKAGEIVEVTAWSVDKVGNESRKDTWSVLLDQDIVYVSDSGNDLYEGTRLRPFRSIEKALITAGVQKKTTIYISAGSYEINRPVEAGGKISLLGGLDKATWEPSGVSLIKTGRYFPENKPLFSFRGTAEIRDIRFGSDRNIESPITGLNSDLIISNVDTLAGSSFRYLLKQERGSTHISDSKLTAGGSNGFFAINRGNLTLENCEISGPGGNDVSLIQLEGGSLQVEHSSLLPSTGERTTAVTAANAYIAVNDSHIYSGSGRRKATVFSVTRGELSIRNSQMENEAGARTSVAVEAAGARLSIENSTVILSGQSGTTGFLLKDSQLDIKYSKVRSGNHPGFVFMLQQENGAVDMQNTTVSIAASGEPVIADVKGGRLTLNHNTILVASDRRSPAGILSKNGTQLFVTNTILSNTGSENGTALSGDSSTSWSIRSSNFGNWSRTAVYGDAECKSPEDLDMLDADPFGGWLNGNIEESPGMTFSDRPFALKESSACIDAGVVTGPSSLDMDGQKRPNPEHGIRPFPDIGADEFYPGDAQ